jgi:glucosamine--fructose-6-phosphate aminotransferase (isomerizing)
MCGIVGYLGKNPAKPVLLDSLARLEYRGYDSCGIAVQGSPLKVFKDTQRVKELATSIPELPGTVGVGHTRWATHGGVTRENAHPHMDCSNDIAVVHNGIIDNYQELREVLIQEGHSFTSETDTEVIAHLIEKYYKGNLETATTDALNRLKGSWAIVAVTAGERKLVATRHKAPLIIGLGDGEFVVASDAPAIIGHANSVVYLEDGDVAVIDKEGLNITNGGREVKRQPKQICWGTEDIGKNGYEHYTLKEIYEQPDVMRASLSKYLIDEDTLREPSSFFQKDLASITILACGTSYHAGLVGKHVIEDMLNIPVAVINASEFAYRPALGASLAIAITQSGETADVLEAARRIHSMGVPILAITNVPYSSVTSLASQVIYTGAGPEVGVAATKTYTSQLAALLELVMSSPKISAHTHSALLTGLTHLADKIRSVCARESVIEECARFLAAHERAFYIARGINLPTAYEGALKMKELAYIHAEGYSAGELKHGPFALLDERTPTIAIMADDETHQSMLSTIHEVRARSSPVIAISFDGDDLVDKLSNFVIRVPRVPYPFTPIINAVALQLLAYHTAKFRSCPIDFPRNIAKSVTVE